MSTPCVSSWFARLPAISPVTFKLSAAPTRTRPRRSYRRDMIPRKYVLRRTPSARRGARRSDWCPRRAAVQHLQGEGGRVHPVLRASVSTIAPAGAILSWSRPSPGRSSPLCCLLSLSSAPLCSRSFPKQLSLVLLNPRCSLLLACCFRPFPRHAPPLRMPLSPFP
jgi:hypothetical protein